MPPNPSEPDKYSLDDMLERLQAKPAPGPEDAGELVTRADGTQAIKVRKRKRRSVQPHKEAAKREMRIRAFQVSSVVILVVLLGLTLGGLVVYANSAAYRSNLLAKLNTATGAKTQISQLRVTPTSSNAFQVDFNWPEGNLLKSLSLTQVRAQSLLGGVVGNHWGADEISAAVGMLRISDENPDEPSRSFPPATGQPPVSFERMSVSRADVLIGNSTSPSVQLLQTEATFYPRSETHKASVRLVGGDARFPDWPPLRLDRSLLEFKDDNIEVVTLRLLHELDNTGNIELSGIFNPHATGSVQKLDVKMSSFNLNGIAGNSLGQLVSGRIDSQTPGDNHLAFSGASGGTLKVAFASSPNTFPRLNGFRFLSKLSKLVDNPWFIDPVFHDGCTGILQCENGTVSITDLAITSRLQLAVTGNLTVLPNDVLEGTLNVGLPEATVASSTNPKVARIFSESRDGFRWITLKISGTGSRPVDNFDEVAQTAPVAPDSSAEGDLFERLTAPKND